MEVDEIQTQVRKFQRIGSNGSTANSDNTSNPHKIATQKANSDLQNVNQFAGEDGGGITGGGVARLCGWPSSRIVRVSRASGGKDRHSKVLTSKGLRDRRVRLSVTTAIQFYDLQDRLGYDQPSKAVEWLIKAASSSIAELPSLDPAFSGAGEHQHHHRQVSDEKKSTGNNGEFEDLSYQNNNNTHNQQNVSKSSACSSTSETSKGSGLSLSRSENRIRARERAREMAAKKEKEKEQNSSFTDLLTGGISSAAVSPTNESSPATSPMDYYFFRPPQFQMPQFNIIAGDGNNTHHHHHPQHHFSFLQESFAPVVTTAGGGVSGGGESYNLNFSIASSSPGFNRGTLQSNLSSILPHHNHHLQRFQSSSMVDGSTSTNFPFFAAPTAGASAPEHFPASGYDSQRLQLYGGGDGADHHKEKRKN